MSKKDEERFSIGFFTFSKEGYLVNVPKELVDEDHPLLYKPFDGIKYINQRLVKDKAMIVSRLIVVVDVKVDSEFEYDENISIFNYI